MRTELKFFCYNKNVDLLLLLRKSFIEDKTVNDFNRWVQYQKATNLYNINISFVSAIYTFSLAGNIIVYTPNQSRNREKYINHIIYKGKMPTLAGDKHLSVHLFLHGPPLFHFSTEKVRVQSVRNGHQSGYSRADTKNYINKWSKKFSIKGIYNKKHIEK